jgi:hypothetical protein
MTRPHIYGDETKCRAAVARYIGRGEELLAQAAGVRKEVDHAKATQEWWPSSSKTSGREGSTARSAQPREGWDRTCRSRLKFCP